MKSYNGFGELLLNRKDLPDVGWLFVEKSFNLASREDISKKHFFIAETEDEEIAAEKKYKTWLESPTFMDILDIKLKQSPQASLDELIDAAIYYLEKDAFME